MTLRRAVNYCYHRRDGKGAVDRPFAPLFPRGGVSVLAVRCRETPREEENGTVHTMDVFVPDKRALLYGLLERRKAPLWALAGGFRHFRQAFPFISRVNRAITLIAPLLDGETSFGPPVVAGAVPGRN